MLHSIVYIETGKICALLKHHVKKTWRLFFQTQSVKSSERPKRGVLLVWRQGTKPFWTMLNISGWTEVARSFFKFWCCINVTVSQVLHVTYRFEVPECYYVVLIVTYITTGKCFLYRPTVHFKYFAPLWPFFLHIYSCYKLCRLRVELLNATIFILYYVTHF